MKKKLSILFLMLGFLLIIIAVIISFCYKSDANLVDEAEITVDTSVIYESYIDNLNYSFYSSDVAYNKTYIKSFDLSIKKKVEFLYPENLDCDYYLEYYKLFKDSSLSVEAFTADNGKDYISELKKSYSPNGDDEMFNYAISDSIIIDNHEVQYIKFEKISGSDSRIYNENFYIVIYLGNDELLIVNYMLENYKFTDEFLSFLINNISITNAENYSIGSVEGDNIILKLQNNLNYDLSHGYKADFTISNDKYTEIEYIGNSLNQTTIVKKDSDFLNFNVVIKLSSDTNDDIYSLIVLSTQDYFLDYKLLSDLDIDEKMYDGKTYNIITTKYMLGETEYNYIKIFNVIDKNSYYTITISSHEEITDSIISDFLNFSLEKF